MLGREGGETPLVVTGILSVCVVLGAAAIGLDRLTFEEQSGIITVTTLVALTLPILTWLGRQEHDTEIVRLLVWGMVATVLGILARYLVVTLIYNDSTDPRNYSIAATELLRFIKSGAFGGVFAETGRPPETQRVSIVLSFVYVVTGTSRWAGSVAFAWMAFAGRLLMWRAVKRAVPEADHKRYLLLLLFFPSLLYWPASIGKESLMMLALGVVSYGAALLLSDKVRAWSIVVFVGGVAGLVLIRPHYGALAVMALGAGAW